MPEQKRFRISFNSPVILTFSAICLVTLILSYITGGKSTLLFFSVYRSSFSDPLTYFRFIGHIFGHSGWNHFFGNITLLLVVGPLLEEKYGSFNLCLIIFATAIVTGILNFIMFPNTMLLGASGVVFAFILLSSLTSFSDGSIPLTFIVVSIVYIGEQIYDAIFIKDNIANFTHIVGGILGALFGFMLNKKK